MWNNVTVLEEHISGTPHQVATPLENSGTPWGVRYTRLTSTAVKDRLTKKTMIRLKTKFFNLLKMFNFDNVILDHSFLLFFV